MRPKFVVVEWNSKVVETIYTLIDFNIFYYNLIHFIVPTAPVPRQA
jgi:hypothetical protein